MNVSYARKRRLVRNKLKSPFTHIKKGKSCAFQLSRMKKETFSFALSRKKRKKIFSRELPGGEGFFRVVELCSGRGFPDKKKLYGHLRSSLTLLHKKREILPSLLPEMHIWYSYSLEQCCTYLEPLSISHYGIQFFPFPCLSSSSSFLILIAASTSEGRPLLPPSLYLHEGGGPTSYLPTFPPHANVARKNITKSTNSNKKCGFLCKYVLLTWYSTSQVYFLWQLLNPMP